MMIESPQSKAELSLRSSERGTERIHRLTAAATDGQSFKFRASCHPTGVTPSQQWNWHWARRQNYR